MASGAYGRDWADRGRSHLCEAALLLAALWPSGAPPAVQGTTVHRISLLRHLSPVKAIVAAGVAVAAVATGTALAASVTPKPAARHTAVAVQPVTLQPTSPQPAPASLRPSSLPPSSPRPASVPPTSATPTPVPPTPVPPTSEPPVSSPPPDTSPASPPLPQITGVTTYQQGEQVYFKITYADPGNDAEGFGFVGVNGYGIAEENHPFSDPSYGIVGPGTVAYPFTLECGTAQAYQSQVEAWIYDTAGDRSKPVVIDLACDGSDAGTAG